MTEISFQKAYRQKRNESCDHRKETKQDYLRLSSQT